MSIPAPTAARAFRWRLSTQMVAWSLGLLLTIQAAIVLVVQASTRDNARRTGAAELVVAERVWARLVEQRAVKLAQGAAVLAADYGFREAIASDDTQTIASALENHSARIEAELVALLDTRGQVRVAAGSHGADPKRLGEAWSRLGLSLARQGHGVGILDGRPVQFVLVPVRAPAVIGHVLMGFSIAEGPLLTELRDITGQQATVVVQRSGVPQRVLHSTLQPAGLADAVASAAVAGASDAALPQDTHLVRRMRLAAAGEDTIWLVLSQSLDQALKPFHTLLLTLAALTGVAVLLFGLASLWASRRVTRPLQQLVDASERLANGDYATPVGDVHRDDEVGELSHAFERMRVSVANQQHEIRRMAFWDRLTGLPNRLQFREALQGLIAEGTPTTVILLDLDRFKHVNDVLGYAQGDRLLQALSRRLEQVATDGVLVARLGGNEFAMLAAHCDAAGAHTLAARIEAALSEPLDLDDQRVDLHAGLGMACSPEHAGDADTLISRAEIAMYAAKQRTSGPVLYDASLDQASAQTLSLLTELREAMQHQQMKLYLQPKVRVSDGTLCGAEALVRWQHPIRGLVPPMAFIPFAEQTGFIRELTLWVFEEAARQLAPLRDLGLQRISVNLSTRDLMDIELPDKLQALLQRHGARPEGICLEITESAIMDDPSRAESTLNRLSGLGFKLSIDDFGTGYSSLAYLRRLPVQELKVDKSFVMSMATEPGDAKIVRSTIDLAHNLGLSVVAEGVEDAAIVALLRDLGCDEAQGYHFGKPVPVERFAQSFAGLVAAHPQQAGTTAPAGTALA